MGGGADGVKTRAADPNERSSLGVRAGNSTAISSALEFEINTNQHLILKLKIIPL